MLICRKHTFLSSPSLCTAQIVRDYFQTGALPAPHTVCDVDEVPFQAANENTLPQESEALWDSLKYLAHKCRS